MATRGDPTEEHTPLYLKFCPEHTLVLVL
jgi:hypothetical protein